MTIRTIRTMMTSTYVENLIHFFFTATILIQNVLSRFDIINHSAHFHTVLLYTFFDCCYLFRNPRVFSIILHHIACCDLVFAALTHHPRVDCHNLVILEVTTFLNVCHKLYRNALLRQVKIVAWVLIRVILLPIIIFNISQEVIAYDYQVFLRYSYSLFAMLILSLEWTNEVAKTNIKCISSLVYIIPLFHHYHSREFLSILFSLYIGVSSAFFHHDMIFENRMLINFATSYMLLM